MNYSTDNIIEFIKDLSGTENVSENSDIFDELGMTGDDFHEMIEKYASKYSVDMSGYLWYFHTNEEGHGLGEYFFTPPYERVKRIPVTPAMLKEFVDKGKWEIQYPEHKLPKKRYDLILNQIVVGFFFAGLLVYFIIKWTR